MAKGRNKDQQVAEIIQGEQGYAPELANGPVQHEIQLDGSTAPAASTGNGDAASTAKKAKSTETKAQKWRRLVQRRMAKTLKSIAVLIPLASRNVYDYDPSEVRQVMDALTDAVNDVSLAYEGQRKPDTAFRLH